MTHRPRLGEVDRKGLARTSDRGQRVGADVLCFFARQGRHDLRIGREDTGAGAKGKQELVPVACYRVSASLV